MSFLLKSLRVFPSVCLVCIFLNFYVKAVADQAILTAIEENITEILKRSQLPPSIWLFFKNSYRYALDAPEIRERLSAINKKCPTT